MKRVIGIAGMVLVAACREWPAPEIVGIIPSEMVASETTSLVVRVGASLAKTIDYEKGTAELDSAATLRIGDRTLGTGTFPNDGVFTVTVPTVFEPGSYDVRVTLEDAREAIRPAGFTVLAGEWPDGYLIDPIGPQQRLAPFYVTVRATGANAASFRGNVRLEVPTGGSLGPALSDPFVGGVLVQQVVMDTPRGQEILIVTDVAGHRATSNEFTLQ